MSSNWTLFVAIVLATFGSEYLPAQTGTFPSLFPGRCYSTGDIPNVSVAGVNLTTADIDGDGFVDFASIDPETDLLTVWINNGQRLFEPNINIPIPDMTSFAGIGNFNGDGLPDIVLQPEFASGPDDIFWIVSSSKDSIFEVSGPIQIPSMTPPLIGPTVEVGDFNGDGLDDIVATGTFSDSIVLENDGANQFSLQAVVDVNVTFTSPAVVADMDMDGDLDLVYSTSLGPEIYLNNGNANFGLFTPNLNGFGEYFAGDVNGDGSPDLIESSTFPGSQINVFLNEGNLQFAQSELFDLGGSQVTFVELLDINGDNDIDIVFGGANPSTIGQGIFVLDNETNANFGEPRFLLNGFLSFSDAVAFADIENDGDGDLVFSSSFSDQVCVVETNDDGAADIQVLQRDSEMPESANLVDVDNDSDLDLVIIEPQISVFLNPGDGSFSEPLISPFGTGSVGSAFGDVDNDSDVDIVIASGTMAQVSIALNNGDGTFAQGPLIDLPEEAAPRCVAVGDFDADSDLDVAAVFVLPNLVEEFVAIILNQGDGSFTVQPSFPTVGPLSNNIAVADLDGDTDLDFAVTSAADDTTTILFNAGDATFPVSDTFLLSGFPVSIGAADMDGDLDRDLVISDGDADEVVVFWNDGLGDFPFSTSHSVDLFQNDLAIDDFDCDGLNDIFVGRVGLLRNLGDSNFAPFEPYYADFSQSATATGDIDNDGNPDFVSVTAQSIQASLNQISNVGDVNRDGVVDLLDVSAFVDVLVSGRFQKEADTNFDGLVNLQDVSGFIDFLTGG